MPIAPRRPGVPPKQPTKTKVVDQLIEYAAVPSTPARRTFRKPSAVPVKPESGYERWAEARVALRAEIAAMSDEQFDAFLEEIDAAGVGFMADAYRRERQ